MRHYHTEDELAYRRQRKAAEQSETNRRIRKTMGYVACVGGALIIVLWASCTAHAYRAPWPWVAIADCESGDGDGQPPYTAAWHYDGYFDGGLQFLPSTWRDAIRLVPGVQPGLAWQASPRVQVRVAQRWLRATSWEQWPVCSRRVGVR